jgi:hypothetical protein
MAGRRRDEQEGMTVSVWEPAWFVRHLNKVKAQRLERERSRPPRPDSLIAAVVLTIGLAILAIAGVASWATSAVRRPAALARVLLLALLLAAGCASLPPGLATKLEHLETAITLDHSATAAVSTDARTVAFVESNRAAIRADVAALRSAVSK